MSAAIQHAATHTAIVVGVPVGGGIANRSTRGSPSAVCGQRRAATNASTAIASAAPRTAGTTHGRRFSGDFSASGAVSHSSASFTSCADWNRSPGSLARQVRMI